MIYGDSHNLYLSNANVHPMSLTANSNRVK